MPKCGFVRLPGRCRQAFAPARVDRKTARQIADPDRIGRERCVVLAQNLRKPLSHARCLDDNLRLTLLTLRLGVRTQFNNKHLNIAMKFSR